MNVGSDRKTEGPQSGSKGCVQCGCRRPVTPAKMFDGNVNREGGGADQPRGPPPHDSRLVCGERSENDADDKVHDTEEYHGPKPTLVA